MSNHRGRRPRVWVRPVVAWIVLILLALTSLGSAFIPLGPFNTALNLAIAGIMVVLLWLFLMDLIGSDALVRLIAAAGLLWISFMFALTFTDYLSRACESPGGGPPAFCVDQKIGRGTF
jgi:cytochrome c oxidase subunit IV